MHTYMYYTLTQMSASVTQKKVLLQHYSLIWEKRMFRCIKIPSLRYYKCKGILIEFI